MARQNLVILHGFLFEDPIIMQNEAGESYYASARVIVSRGVRPTGDGKNHLKCESILVLTQDKHVIREMESHKDAFGNLQPAWKQHDIVEIKGMLTERTIQKSSVCPHCKKRNTRPGSLVFVNPVFARRRGRFETREECIKYLDDEREVSNLAFVVGDLCRDPSQVTPKEGITFTQYQIAINRKYHIREDAPNITTDFPWVKSYGDNGILDLQRLHVGSSVLIDGFLQSRSVLRHAVCGQQLDEKGRALFDSDGKPVMAHDLFGEETGCGGKYDWIDRATELVPYATEYLENYYSEEEAAENERKHQEDLKKQVAMRAEEARRKILGV